MSHVVMSKARIRDTAEDLAAVELACQTLGLEFCRGQTEHKWFGNFLNDSDTEDDANKQGVRPADYGKCSHAIRLRQTDEQRSAYEKAPDSRPYEIGLVKLPTGDFGLVFDEWRCGVGVGEMLEKTGGNQFPKLMRAVSQCKVTQAVAKQRGHYIKRIDQLDNGRTKVVIGVRQGDRL
jgi:hypothetical protein